MSPVLQLQSATKAYGNNVLFDNASFAVNEGEHLGVIGPNGAGKSTLFKVLVEKIALDTGQVVCKRGLQIGYLEQEENWDINESILNWLVEETGKAEWQLQKVLAAFAISAEQSTCAIATLSGGFRMRVKLTALIISEPELLLLDEPTNYLDLETLIVLENFLLNWKGAFLIISHDREFLTRVTDHTLEIEVGEITKFPGNIEDYFEQKSQLRELTEKKAKNLDVKRKHLTDFVNRFRAKATKAKQAQSRLKSLQKMESISFKKLPLTAQIPIPVPRKTSKQTVQIKSGQMGYENKIVIDDVNCRLERGDHLAIVGVNGAGKSTLLKTLAGKIPALQGDIELGFGVEFGYFAQHVSEALDEKDTVLGELQGAAHPDVKPQEILDLAGALLFPGDDVKKPISVLSGGERSRVALAQILLKKYPCLLLDEPTNHLDFQTVEALTQSLNHFTGTLLVVSHDRSFIKGIANKILEVRDGQANFYPGTYDEYVWSVQKGVLSIEEDSPTSELDSQSHKSSRPSGNYKKLKKDFEKTLRDLKKSHSSMERKISTIESQVHDLNNQLLEISGAEAAELAQNLHFLKGKQAELEGTWLEVEAEIEKYQIKLKQLTN